MVLTYPINTCMLVYYNTVICIHSTTCFVAVCLWVPVESAKCYLCYSHIESECVDPYDTDGAGAAHVVSCDTVAGCSKASSIGKYIGIKFKSGK